MAEVTRKRTGELIRIVVEMLFKNPDGLPAQELLDHIPQAIELTEYERGTYPSDPNL